MSSPNNHIDTIKHIGDGIAMFLAGATFAKVLPPIAALVTIIWTGMRIWEGLTGLPFSQSRLARWITRKP